MNLSAYNSVIVRAMVIALAVRGAAGCGCYAGGAARCCGCMGRRRRRQIALRRWRRSRSAYLRAEGYWGLEQYDEANEQFRIAIAQPERPAL